MVAVTSIAMRGTQPTIGLDHGLPIPTAISQIWDRRIGVVCKLSWMVMGGKPRLVVNYMWEGGRAFRERERLDRHKEPSECED